MSNLFDQISDNNEIDRLRRERREQEYRSVIDRLIDEAQKEGKFDNLPGQGRPLRLKKNPYAEEESLAYELLQNNDYTLPWIADRNEILAAIDTFRADLSQRWQNYRRALQEGESAAAIARAHIAWQEFLQQQRQVATELNGKIAALNLKIPVERLEVLKISFEREIQRLSAGDTARE